MPLCSVVRLEKKHDIKLARLLIEKYHAQGMKLGGTGSKIEMYYAYVCDNYITSVAWLHGSEPFSLIAKKFSIPVDKSLFIRRATNTCPSDYLVQFLKDLAQDLKAKGYQVIWTLGSPDSREPVYEQAGFKLLGKTSRTKHHVYALFLVGNNEEYKSERQEI